MMFCPGKDCLCRRDAPRLGSLVCPLCWRCSGIVLGSVLGSFLAPALRDALPGCYLVLASVVCWTPALVDVLAQIGTAHAYRSGRWIRLLTGAVLGVGIWAAGALVAAGLR
jgi:uncharacterized membrane protein